MNKNVFIFIIEIAILTGIALAFDLIPALHFTIWPLDSIIYLSSSQSLLHHFVGV